MERAERYVSKMIAMIKRPEMRILPGELAFFVVISLIPLAALLGAIASKLSIDVSAFQNLMQGTIPPAVASFLVEIMNNKSPDFNITMFFISAFVLASNGPHSMIVASNEIYKIKPRDYFTRRLKALLMTIVMVVLFFILFLIPIFGDYIFKLVTTNITDAQVHRFMYVSYQLIKYPLLIVVLHFNIKLLYIIAPDDKIKSMTTTKGSIFTTIGWIIATEVYSVYIGAFTSYDKFYGSISNLVILFLWVYILSYIFVLGMIINAGSYKAKKEELEKVVE